MLDMQNVKDIEITEGDVRTIHDKDSRLIWGRLAYDTKYAGDTLQNGTPSPDTPIPVQTVTGEQTVEVTGKNLWNPTPYKTGKTINASGVEVVTADGSIWELKNVSANITFTISLKNNYVYAGNLRVHAYTSTGSWIEQVEAKLISENTSGSLTFTTPANTAFLRWGFWSDVSDAQLELGPTATAYEPYQSQSYPISLIGKNLWNPTPYMTGYVLNSSGGLYTLSDGAIWETSNILVGEQYTITVTAPSGGNIRIHAYKADGTWIEQVAYKRIANGETDSVSFTIPAQTAVLRWGFFIGSTNMQLELGSATSYVPYYNYELCKIGDYQDYIYKSGDDWYVHKEIRHLSLPIADMENGENYPGWKNQGVVLTDLPSMNNGLKTVTHYYCNVTVYDAYSGSDAAIYTSNTGSGASAGGLVMLLNTGLTQTQLKERYPNLVVEVYYGIVNPVTDTQITDATLIGQLNAVHEWLTRYGYNATVAGNLPVIISKTNL